MNLYQILQWDTEFFDFKVARINKDCCSIDEFTSIYRELVNNDVKLIYWQVPPDCIYQYKIAEKFNGLLVDIKTTYSLKLEDSKFNIDEDLVKTEILNEKIPNNNLLEIAVQCGKYSRFHVDSTIPNEKFEELYKTWLVKSLAGEMADNVLISKRENMIAGLITVYCKNNIGTIGLIGVHSNYRGQGVGGELIKSSLIYFEMKDCDVVNVVTQAKNEAACKLYEKYGFKVLNQVNFYHFWSK